MIYMLPRLKSTAHISCEAGRGTSGVEGGIGQKLQSSLTSGSEKFGTLTLFRKTFTYYHVSLEDSKGWIKVQYSRLAG